MVNVNHDATSCYDRIIPNLAMLVSRKNKVARSVTQSSAQTLENSEYKLRTEQGRLAVTGYQHSEKFPIYGTGQGSGNSPAIWCFMSSLLFDCYDLSAYGANYSNPERTEDVSLGRIRRRLQWTSKLFSRRQAIVREVVQELEQHDAQLWTVLLSPSGGSLELSKWSYHYLKWVFSTHGAPVLTDVNSLPDIIVKDQVTGITKTLKKLSPYEAHKTLVYY